MGADHDQRDLKNDQSSQVYGGNESGVWSSSETFASTDLKVSAFSEALAASLGFSGVVSVRKNSAIIYENAFGKLGPDSEQSNSLDARFNLASMGKMFTAVAIMQLVEQGHLRLEDSVEDIMPGVFDKRISNATVQDLLNHRSGFGHPHEQHGFENGELYSTQDYVEFIASTEGKDPESVVKKRTAILSEGQKGYSNSGYYLLGRIVELASKENQEFFSYLRQNMFSPAGMSEKTGPVYSFPAEGAAVGFVSGISSRGVAFRTPNPAELRMYRSSAAGGIYSTQSDLQLFADALINHRLLDFRHTQMLLGTAENDALGLMQAEYSGSSVRGHTGLWQGVSTAIDIYPNINACLVVLGNVSDAGIEFGRRLREYLIDQKKI